jgi:collagenase-like PrtC family protease
MSGAATTTAAGRPGRLSLGPVLFNWAPERWRDFYFRIADEAPLDVVYVGEVVCSKRAPFFAPVLPEVVERLERAGKEVVHSTLALIMSEREMETVRETAAADLYVEANDLAAAALLAGRRHVIGPLVNVYNEGTVAYLARRGADRVCLPVELPGESIRRLAAARPAGVAFEVQVFGRLPLAISARCYHARSRELHKDNCQFACGDDLDGMDLESLDGQPFLAVNGTQTMSYAYACLAEELPALAGMGVELFRLWPHTADMVAVADAFRGVLDGRTAAAEAVARLEGLAGGIAFANGYFHGRAGLARIEAVAE